jgi:hypothetical protein
LVQRL